MVVARLPLLLALLLSAVASCAWAQPQPQPAATVSYELAYEPAVGWQAQTVPPTPGLAVREDMVEAAQMGDLAGLQAALNAAGSAPPPEAANLQRFALSMPLQVAARLGRRPAIVTILTAGHSWSLVPGPEAQPLLDQAAYIAARANHAGATADLLDAGASLDMALQGAKEGDRSGLVEALKKREKSNAPMVEAKSYGFGGGVSQTALATAQSAYAQLPSQSVLMQEIEFPRARRWYCLWICRGEMRPGERQRHVEGLAEEQRHLELLQLDSATRQAAMFQVAGAQRPAYAPAMPARPAMPAYNPYTSYQMDPASLPPGAAMYSAPEPLPATAQQPVPQAMPQPQPQQQLGAMPRPMMVPPVQHVPQAWQQPYAGGYQGSFAQPAASSAVQPPVQRPYAAAGAAPAVVSKSARAPGAGSTPPAGPPPRCFLPKDSGPCRAATPAWHFDAEKNSCERFTFGGCGGNANKFASEDACRRACSASAPSEPSVKLTVAQCGVERAPGAPAFQVAPAAGAPMVVALRGATPGGPLLVFAGRRTAEEAPETAAVPASLGDCAGTTLGLGGGFATASDAEGILAFRLGEVGPDGTAYFVFEGDVPQDGDPCHDYVLQAVDAACKPSNAVDTRRTG